MPKPMQFYVGLHQLNDAQHFERAFISVNRLAERKGGFKANKWILDSGAFTLLDRHGAYPEEPEAYAEQIARWSKVPGLQAAVSQDYMCEPHMLAKTGKTIAEHQALTVERYDRLLKANRKSGVYLMPVLQGWTPGCYLQCLRLYGRRLKRGAWVGVGTVCKRNTNEFTLMVILDYIKRERPDLKLHGFGLKQTALSNPSIIVNLHSADSMAWSFAARKNGGNPNCWKEAKLFEETIALRMSANGRGR